MVVQREGNNHAGASVNFYMRFEDDMFTGLFDRATSSIEQELHRAIVPLDGDVTWARTVGPFPPGRDRYSARLKDTFGPSIQAGGAASRLLVQVSGVDPENPDRLHNIGRSAPDTAQSATEVVNHGPGWTKVYPEEVFSADEAVFIMSYYVRHETRLPQDVHLRSFDDRPGRTGTR